MLGAGDFDVLLAHGKLLFKEPADGGRRCARAIGQDAVVVSEAFALKARQARRRHRRAADAARARAFRVAAVYFDYSSDRGVVVMDRGTFARYFGEQRPTSLTVYLRPGRDPDAVREPT